MIFCIFIQLILLGVGFLNRPGAEIDNQLYKKMQKIHYLLLKKFKNTERAHRAIIYASFSSRVIAKLSLSLSLYDRSFKFDIKCTIKILP